MSSDLDQKSHEMFRVATANNGVLVYIATLGRCYPISTVFKKKIAHM